MMVKEYRYGICTWVHEVWFVKTAKGNAGIVRYMYLVDGMVEGMEHSEGLSNQNF